MKWFFKPFEISPELTYTSHVFPYKKVVVERLKVGGYYAPALRKFLYAIFKNFQNLNLLCKVYTLCIYIIAHQVMWRKHLIKMTMYCIDSKRKRQRSKESDRNEEVFISIAFGLGLKIGLSLSFKCDRTFFFRVHWSSIFRASSKESDRTKKPKKKQKTPGLSLCFFFLSLS